MSDLHPERNRRPWRTDAEWRRLAERMAEFDAGRRRPPWYRRAGIAAAAVLAIAVSYSSFRARYSEPDGSAEPTRVIRTAAGQRLTVRLSDGTRVDLGPATTLRYHAAVGSRQVELAGLANFTVMHDPKREFVVRAGNARVTDIGTIFTVRAYDADSLVAIAVTEGIVAVSGDSTRATLSLHAGNTAHVGRDGAVRADPAPDAGADASWVDGSLRFRNATMQQVALELSRWFDVEVRIADHTLGQRRVNALYTTPTLVGVLDALSATVNARYEQDGRRVVLFPRRP